MQQKELAALLNISPAMVSRLAKRGMPTDTLERAERWRRRHLEPGRVKGNRADFNPHTKQAPASHASPPGPVGFMSDAEVELISDLVNGALARGNHELAASRVLQLRERLALAAPDASPRLTVRVWLALLGYMLHKESEFRNAPDMDAMLTPGECGARVSPAWPWPAHTVIVEACDSERYSVNGWPEGYDDDPD